MSEQRPPTGTDDLDAWADDDLVRALRAPGSPTELAGQDRFVAAFRAAGDGNVRSLPRRAAGRLGAGGTAVVVTVALTSGMAAAYTGSLPEPVQQIAHTVIGAPAPDAGPGHHRASPVGNGVSVGHGDSTAAGSVGGSTSTSGGPTPGASSTPGTSTSPTTAAPPVAPPARHSASAGPSPTSAPGSPTAGPTTGPPTPSSGSGAAASAMSMGAPSHRVGVGSTITLTGLVTDATGTPVPDHPVLLQVRGPRRWRPLVETTTDSAGVATATTAAVTQTMRVRWRADRGITSPAWVVRMVPSVSVSADVEGVLTTLTPTTLGSSAGDRIAVFKHVAGHSFLVRRARLDATGATQVTVNTPQRRAAFVVRLLPTRRHAAASARVVVVPPKPAAVSIAGADSRVLAGTATVIGGAVTSSTGSVLPGRRVVLLRRGATRWQPVGHAVTDSSGRVSIPTPAIEATTRFRLRTGSGIRSSIWRVVELPSLSASAQRAGTTVTISASASGGRAGDRVVLLHRVDGRLVRMRHAPLGADGSVTFTVPARKLGATYVVRLLATAKHAAASTSLTVPGTG